MIDFYFHIDFERIYIIGYNAFIHSPNTQKLF